MTRARAADEAAGTKVSRCPPRSSQAAELAGLDQVDEDVPFRRFQDGGVRIFADPDQVAFDDDFGAVIARWAERDSVLFHVTSPPFASMCGQTAAE